MSAHKFTQSDITELEHDANVKDRRLMLGFCTGVIVDGLKTNSPLTLRHRIGGRVYISQAELQRFMNEGARNQ